MKFFRISEKNKNQKNNNVKFKVMVGTFGIITYF